MTGDDDSLERDIQKRQCDLKCLSTKSLRNMNPFLVSRPNLAFFSKPTSHSELFHTI